MNNNVIISLIAAVVAYFDPIKGVIHLMIIVILVDLITGVIASKAQGCGIRSIRLWRTVYKLFYAIALVALTFALDKELDMIQMHRYFAWMIICFELWSIMENAAKTTNHRIFRLVKVLMEDKIKSVTGIDLKDKK